MYTSGTFLLYKTKQIPYPVFDQNQIKHNIIYIFFYLLSCSHSLGTPFETNSNIERTLFIYVIHINYMKVSYLVFLFKNLNKLNLNLLYPVNQNF